MNEPFSLKCISSLTHKLSGSINVGIFCKYLKNFSYSSHVRVQSQHTRSISCPILWVGGIFQVNVIWYQVSTGICQRNYFSYNFEFLCSAQFIDLLIWINFMIDIQWISLLFTNFLSQRKHKRCNLNISQ